MAASVRIEDEAFGDPRFQLLGLAMGLPVEWAEDWGRGIMARVWRYCTARSVYIVSRDVINALARSDRFADALIGCDLGETSDGGIRIKGTKGRIEWLKHLRKSASKAGKASAATRAQRAFNGRSTNRSTDVERPGLRDLNAPAPAPVTAPVTEDQKITPPTPLTGGVRASEAKEVLSEALSYLNKLTGKRFEPTEGRVTAVKRILAEGRRLEDLRVVIWSKCKGEKPWLGDERMDQHLNPDTLLRKSNFQRYLEQGREELKRQRPDRARELGYVDDAPAPPPRRDNAMPLIANLADALTGGKS